MFKKKAWENTLNSPFSVVTDIAEIARLNKELGRRLATSFKVRRTREITTPSGHHAGTVYFESAVGNDVRAWSPDSGPIKLTNYLLAGDPAASTWMQINVQINFPAGTYQRRTAGAFVIDEHGVVLVAHRGKLTRKVGLPKAKVFQRFASLAVEADDNGQTSKVILISSLDDPRVADRLWQFALEAREVATEIASEEEDIDADDKQNDRRRGGLGGGRKPTFSPKAPTLRLRDYFDEYAGEGNFKGHGGGKRTVEHGDVVKALELQLRASGSSQKAQTIDLAIVAAQVDLFEVKTSARTTDVYTGVGQLLIHGECIRELLDLPVHRHLVLPALPHASHGKHVTNKGGHQHRDL